MNPKKTLDSIRSDYLESMKKIRQDLEENHQRVLENFIFHFHKALTRVLLTSSNLTLEEIQENYSQLSSRIYDYKKRIKDKEDALLGEKDKKSFAQLKKEIGELKNEKAYFTVVEQNIASNSLLKSLDDIIRKIEHLRFSGDQVWKDNVIDLVARADQLIMVLTTIKPEQIGLVAVLMSKLFRKSGKAKPVPVTEEHKQIRLTDQEKEYIKEYVKFRAGEGHYEKYSQAIIAYIERLEHGHLEKMENQLVAKGWKKEYIEPTMNSIREVLQKRNSAQKK